jgi:hypothetical protein
MQGTDIAKSLQKKMRRYYYIRIIVTYRVRNRARAARRANRAAAGPRRSTASSRDSGVAAGLTHPASRTITLPLRAL